jgi:hypothetical protein
MGRHSGLVLRQGAACSLSVASCRTAKGVHGRLVLSRMAPSSRNAAGGLAGSASSRRDTSGAEATGPAVDRIAPLSDTQEQLQQVDDGGLAAFRQAHQGGHPPAEGDEAGIGRRRRAVLAGEAHLSERRTPSVPMAGRLRSWPSRYLLISSCRQNLSNSALVHFRSRRHPALHSSLVGLINRLSPPLGTGSDFSGTVGPGGGDV